MYSTAAAALRAGCLIQRNVPVGVVHVDFYAGSSRQLMVLRAFFVLGGVAYKTVRRVI